jgi:hypothetical protein
MPITTPFGAATSPADRVERDLDDGLTVACDDGLAGGAEGLVREIAGADCRFESGADRLRSSGVAPVGASTARAVPDGGHGCENGRDERGSQDGRPAAVRDGGHRTSQPELRL